MTPNPFDQFDAADSAGAPAGNPFDQFDAAPAAQRSGAPQLAGPARLPAMVGGNLAKGALSTAGIPGDVQGAVYGALDRYVAPWTIDPLNRFIFGSKAPTAAQAAAATGTDRGFLNSQALLDAARRAGIVDNPRLQPQNTGERYLSAASQGVGAALPFGLGSLPAAARAVAQGVGAGTGAQAGADLFPEHPNLAPFLGALAGGSLGGGVANAAGRAVNAVTGATSPTLQAYDTLGIKPRLAGDVTGSPMWQRIQAWATKTPGGGGVEAAAKATVDDFGKAVERTADTLGASTTLQQAGKALQDQGADWLEQFRTDQASDWAKVDRLVPAATPTPLTNYATALNRVTTALPSAPATAKVLQPGLPAQLAEALQQDVGTASLRGATLPWGTVKGIRTRIGEMLSDPNLPADTGTADLKQLYRALSADMEGTAATAGPAASAAFNAAKTNTAAGHAFIEDVLSPIVRKGQSPEGAAQATLAAAPRGGTILTALRQQMPDAADELAAFKLRDMALATPGRQNAAGTLSSPASFLSDLQTLSPEARAGLFSTPDAQAKIDALATVADNIRQTAARLNTSNTGAHIGTGAAILGAMEAPFAAIKGYEAGGWPGALAGASSGVAIPAAGAGMGFLTSTPALTRYLATPGLSINPALARLIGASALWGSLPDKTRGMFLGIPRATAQPTPQPRP